MLKKPDTELMALVSLALLGLLALAVVALGGCAHKGGGNSCMANPNDGSGGEGCNRRRDEWTK
jgi:hypothetical protein